MAELKNMTVVTSGKLRKTAYDLLDANTNLLAWKEGGRTPADIFDGWLAQADALYSIGNIKINGALLDKAPNLKVIAQASVGYDNIDVAECNARGIRVGNTPRVLSPAVADLAYGLIIDSARKIARGWQHVASGKWGERKGPWLWRGPCRQNFGYCRHGRHRQQSSKTCFGKRYARYLP